MKIFVINLTKRQYLVKITSVLVVLIVSLSIVIGLVTKIYAKDLIFEAANSIPYDKIIILDAGHGGEDSGAVGVNGTLEKDLNLEITLEIGKILEEKGFIVIYTRTDDRLLYKDEENIKGIRKISDLKNRLAFAKKYPESMLISIHMNSFGDEKYSGTQVYYSKEQENSRILAECIQNQVQTKLQKDNKRTIKAGEDIYLLKNAENISVLVECGFITNKMECEKLSKKEYQKELSFSIVCGIIEYISKISEN